jgi:hypothetical protein
MYLDMLERNEGRKATEYPEVEEGAHVFTRDKDGKVHRAVVVGVEQNPDATRKGKVFRLRLEEGREDAGSGEADTVVVTRNLVWTKQELNPPQSLCVINDILPPTREIKPPSFLQLQRLGVPALDMKRYVHFSHRHAYSVVEWFPVLKKLAYKMQWVALEDRDVAALVKEDWVYLQDSLARKMEALLAHKDLEHHGGLLPRVSTRMPSDEPMTASCMLTTAQAEASQAERDMQTIVTRQKRGRALPLRLSRRLGLPDRHVPDRKDVSAAKQRVKTLSEASLALQRRIGQQRMDKLGIVPRDKNMEVSQLETDRDKLVNEYSVKIAMEKERLSLIDQMHSGPKQTEERNKARARLKYYENSLSDTKEVSRVRLRLRMSPWTVSPH